MRLDKTLKFDFIKLLDLYFFPKNNLLVYIYLNVYVILKLVSNIYFKIDKHAFSLIFFDCSNYFAFLKNILFNYNRFFFIYFFRLNLKGLGYRVVKICKNLYKFYFIMSNYYYLHLPLSVLLKYKSRKLFFYSFDLWTLRVVFINVLLLHKTFIYFIRGLTFPSQIIMLKPGKKRL